jgi:hypothetical protein
LWSFPKELLTRCILVNYAIFYRPHGANFFSPIGGVFSADIIVGQLSIVRIDYIGKLLCHSGHLVKNQIVRHDSPSFMLQHLFANEVEDQGNEISPR